MPSEERPIVIVESPFRWTIVEDERGARVRFAGDLDENVDFSELRARLSGDVEFQLDGITRINSCGVREWVNFVRDLPSVRSLRFTRCSPAVVAQLNAINNFRGAARVRSLVAPYFCERCGVEEAQVLELPDGPLDALPEFRCAHCGEPMIFDEIPERYLSFLRESA